MKRLTIMALLAGAGWAAGPRQFRIPVWTEGSAAAADYQVMLEGRPARVAGVLDQTSGLIVLVVLDVVEELALDSLAKQALENAVAKLPANAHVAVMRAQNGVKVLLDPSTDRGRAAEAIRAVPISGKPALLDSLEMTGRLADAMLKENVRVAALYVTDSDVTKYREDFQNAVVNSSDSHDLSRKFPEALIQEKIVRLEAKVGAQQGPLFIVHVKFKTDRSNEAYQNGLKALAEATGGSAAFCRSNAEVGDAVAGALSAIAAHRSLAVELPAQLPQAVRVQVSVTGGRKVGYRPRFVTR